MSLTAFIDVLFSVNFAVVFDFMYFRFRPSKAKLLGNVLPNRQNAAKRAQEICWRIKDGYTCAAPISWRNDACCANTVMGSKFSASIISKFYLADFFSVRRASANDAGWFSASIGKARYKEEEKQILWQCFAYSVGHCLFILLYWGGNGNR